MKKPLLLIVSFVLFLVVSFLVYKRYTKSFSPEASVVYDQRGLEIEVSYGRPAKKGRYIFGRQQDNALVPYEKVWRTGANEATIIDLPQNVIFAGKPVKAGQYSLWTVPGPGTWKVILNSETGQWGTEYNDGKDVFQCEVPIRIRSGIQQLFTIYFEEQPVGVNMILSWDQTEAVVSIKPQ
ncbi:DUF2911 domain-containing protein [Dyadobacter psychrotolerans]|uniref:DUF2911 domain-containing protein n=1 Tax=Dyadobacter psychrotolerans TaxID=2541721 RepID=A0A4R5DEY4_9BACT|nr:DUF2911 domain-containing protein [Dyadobacter psychrotolerans]TDE12436.1 DUF2911 domain-containing protein [Dyadobacter psychrotolerans]